MEALGGVRMHYIVKSTWHLTPSNGGSVFLWGMINSSCYMRRHTVVYSVVRGLGRNGTGQHRSTVRVSICALRKRSDATMNFIATTLALDSIILPKRKERRYEDSDVRIQTT